MVLSAQCGCKQKGARQPRLQTADMNQVDSLTGSTCKLDEDSCCFQDNLPADKAKDKEASMDEEEDEEEEEEDDEEDEDSFSCTAYVLTSQPCLSVGVRSELNLRAGCLSKELSSSPEKAPPPRSKAKETKEDSMH